MAGTASEYVWNRGRMNVAFSERGVKIYFNGMTGNYEDYVKQVEIMENEWYKR